MLLGVIPKLFGQLNPNGNRKNELISIDKHSPSSPEKINRKGSVYDDFIHYCNLNISFDKDQRFHVVDSMYGFYSPTPSVEDSRGFQILRTFAENSDSSYIIGILAFPVSPLSGTYPLKESLTNEARILMNGNDRFYEPNSCKYLNITQLKNINASNRFGIMYNIKVSKPFKGKYSKCNVIAAKDKHGHYFTLYYFFKETDDKKIASKINSQIGMVKFNHTNIQ